MRDSMFSRYIPAEQMPDEEVRKTFPYFPSGDSHADQLVRALCYWATVAMIPSHAMLCRIVDDLSPLRARYEPPKIRQVPTMSCPVLECIGPARFIVEVGNTVFEGALPLTKEKADRKARAADAVRQLVRRCGPVRKRDLLKILDPLEE